MTRQEVYYTTIGATSLEDGIFAFVTPLKVKRGGLSFDIILSGTPTGRQVLYEATLGRFTFLNEFLEADYHPFIKFPGEPIYVLYKN